MFSIFIFSVPVECGYSYPIAFIVPDLLFKTKKPRPNWDEAMLRGSTQVAQNCLRHSAPLTRENGMLTPRSTLHPLGGGVETGSLRGACSRWRSLSGAKVIARSLPRQRILKYQLHAITIFLPCQGEDAFMGINTDYLAKKAFKRVLYLDIITK
jgi:hypothetical protein